MSELSPVAQHVLDVFENARDVEYVEGVWVVNERTMLAAALRAAADHVPDHQMSAHMLYAIADELENHQ